MASHFFCFLVLDPWRGSGSILRAARRWNSTKKDPPIPQMKTGVPSSRSRLPAPAVDEYARVRYAQGNWIGLEGDREVQNWALMPVGRDTC